MSKEQSNLPSNPAEMLSGLQNVAVISQEAAGPGEGTQFMKFNGKEGYYSYGVEDTEVEEDSLWAINPQSFVHGYQAWVDGELAGEEVVGMNQKPIQKADLPEVDTSGNNRGWQNLLGFQLVCVNGEDEGVTCLFKTTSVGGLKGVNTLIQSILKQAGENAEASVPVVELGSSSYKHKNKSYGTIHSPVFTIKQWESLDAVALSESDEGGDDVGGDEEPTTEAPTRKRRTRRSAA